MSKDILELLREHDGEKIEFVRKAIQAIERLRKERKSLAKELKAWHDKQAPRAS